VKIGVLGGSFDPPHKGHLKLAASAEKALGLDLVLFVPCSGHKLKGHPLFSSPFDRTAMTALAIEGKKQWRLETVELEKGGYSYTVETLAFLAKKYMGCELFLIVGEDSYADLPRWKEPAKIRRLAKIVVFPRSGCSAAGAERGDIVLKARRIDVSSRGLRREIAAGGKPPSLLPKAVWEYILKHSLYRDRTEV